MASIFDNTYTTPTSASITPTSTANSSMGIPDTSQSQTGNNQMLQLFAQSLAMSEGNPSTAIKLAQFLAPLYNIDDPTNKQKLPSSISTQLASLQSASGIVDEIESMIPSLGLSENPVVAATISGPSKNFLSKFGFFEPTKIYNQTREGIAARLARALGETGALTDFDIRRSINLIPDATDSQGAASEKIDRLKRLLNRASEATYQAGLMSSGGVDLNATLLGQ